MPVIMLFVLPCYIVSNFPSPVKIACAKIKVVDLGLRSASKIKWRWFDINI